MDFKKKLKTRLYIAVGYIVIGAIMIAIFNFIPTENTFLSSFGFALVVMGIARTRNYFIITKTEERIEKQRIAETDERNIAISNKAKSVAFSIYLLVTCIAVIVLTVLNKTELAMLLSSSVCVMLIIFYITYFIIRKKS